MYCSIWNEHLPFEMNTCTNQTWESVEWHNLQFNLPPIHKHGVQGHQYWNNQPNLYAQYCKITALLTLEKFDEQTDLAEPKFTQELYIVLRSKLDDREMRSKKGKNGNLCKSSSKSERCWEIGLLNAVFFTTCNYRAESVPQSDLD